ncbi:MAG: aminodeoxychorismate lyase [Marinicella sp.]
MIIATSFDPKKLDSWNNRAFQYGDGVFETMRMHEGELPLWEFHMNRLQRSLKQLILSSINETELKAQIHQHCPKNMIESSVVKLMVFRSNQARTYQPLTQHIEWVVSVNEFNHNSNQTQLKLAVARQKLGKQKLLAGLKHLNRLEQILIASELNEFDDVDDLLVLDDKARIIETTCQNVVMIQNGQLYTPKLKHAGVRGVALDWLASTHKLKEKNMMVDDLRTFEALMVCNSVKGFRLIQGIRKPKTKDFISFGISHPIHDKIVDNWSALFNS